jgi:hypothetical protein
MLSVVVLYACEAWNRLLRIFRPKRDEKAGGWRKLHNEELRRLVDWRFKLIWDF